MDRWVDCLLDGWLVTSLVRSFVSQSGMMARWMDLLLDVCLVDWLSGWLVGRFVGSFIHQSVRYLVNGWLVG